jgi:hypothetical protein
MRKDHAFKSGMWTTMAGIAVLGLGLSAALAAPAAGVVGDWQGTLDTGSGSLRVVLHFSQLKDETFAGTLDSPDQGATGIAIDKVTFRQPDLHFEIRQNGMQLRRQDQQGQPGNRWAVETGRRRAAVQPETRPLKNQDEIQVFADFYDRPILRDSST